MIESAAKMGDELIIVVNNDAQQLLKKKKIILDEQNRTRLMRSLRDVNEVIVSIDEDPSQTKTLEMLAKKYPNDELIFGNGGDRVSPDALPGPEAAICEEYGIVMVFGVGGNEKSDSSTRINRATGHEK
jgi:bifunctional ADP-heptose synthase (sugar kinase/adenylyltransferase)